ncbi:MAG: hypothetical protein U9R42_05815 [Bacteroidota bacterium]|nr:hypothetical protein [Bacteroidota bacterium]
MGCLKLDILEQSGSSFSMGLDRKRALEHKQSEHHIYGSSRLGIHKSDSIFCEFPLEHYYNAFYDSWEPVHYVAVCNFTSTSTYEKLSRQRGKLDSGNSKSSEVKIPYLLSKE